MRQGSKKDLVLNSSHIKMSLQEHQVLALPDAGKQNDLVRLPSKKVLGADPISGAKKELEPPDVELVPESKYKEAYMNLLVKDKRAFHRKVGYQEFHDCLNVWPLYEKQFKKNRFEKLRDADRGDDLSRNLSQQSLKQTASKASLSPRGSKSSLHLLAKKKKEQKQRKYESVNASMSFDNEIGPRAAVNQKYQLIR